MYTTGYPRRREAWSSARCGAIVFAGIGDFQWCAATNESFCMSTRSDATCFRQLPSIHDLPRMRTHTPKTAASALVSYQLLLAAADRVQPKYWSFSGRADHSLPTAIRYQSPRGRLVKGTASTRKRRADRSGLSRGKSRPGLSSTRTRTG